MAGRNCRTRTGSGWKPRLLGPGLFILGWLLLAAPALAQTPWAAVSLRDLSKVGVLVELSGDVPAQGELTPAKMTPRIRGRLHQAGLTTVAVERLWDTAEPALLYLNLVGLKLDGYVVSLRLELRQNVTLLRNQEKLPLVPTWSQDLLAVLAPDGLGKIQNLVDQLVDRFLDDLARANPPFIKRSTVPRTMPPPQPAPPSK